MRKRRRSEKTGHGVSPIGRRWSFLLLFSAFSALSAVSAAAVWVGGCGRGPQAAEGDQLVIYSPHSDEIQAEFELAFTAWYRRRTGREVRFSWPDAGGTTQILKRVQDKFVSGRRDVDLVFGGGPIVERMKQLGYLQPCRLPEPVLAALPKTVAGQPLYDPEYAWYGAAISTFGLIYNKKLIADRGLPVPASWEAMADPRYAGLVAAGDPSKSGSMRKAYEIVLQAYGYEKGMAVLVRMGANARQFYDASSEVPRTCALGFAALGPCIDFYALRQMEGEGGRDLGFVAPQGLTVVNCDPIGMLAGAPNRRAAEAFLEFVMRPEGQRLWMLPVGAPGGPQHYALQRLAALPSVYAELKAAGTPAPMDPFDLPAAAFYRAEEELARLAILPDYLRAALVDNHKPLREAWQALIAAGLPAEGVAELVRPLVTEDQMRRLGREVWMPVPLPDDLPDAARADRIAKEEARLRRQSDLLTDWTRTLRQRYERLALRPAAGPAASPKCLDTAAHAD